MSSIKSSTREIEFRGKEFSAWGEWARWVYGNFIRYRGTEDKKTTTAIISNRGDWRHVDPATVGQYTGLKDNNGVKIYEGDNCQWLGYRAESRFGHCRQIRPIRKRTVGGPADLFTWVDAKNLIEGNGTFKVVGNIHDSQNPEEGSINGKKTAAD